MNGGMVELWIPGRPAPAGSKMAFPVRDRHGVLQWKTTKAGKRTPKLNMAPDSDYQKRWQKAVATWARKLYHDPPMECALFVAMLFSFERPAAHYRSGRFADMLKCSAPRLMTSKPDTTKVVRATEDALTGIVWQDDKQVVAGSSGKLWVRTAQGCRVWVAPIEDQDEVERCVRVRVQQVEELSQMGI